MKITIGLLTGLTSIWLLTGPSSPVSQVEKSKLPGTVKFLQLARSAFDPHTRDPSVQEQAWMRKHYYRMQVWSTYFDTRLSWYPNAWFYKDSYAIYPNTRVFKEHPEWVLRDADGKMLYIPYACSDGSCPQFAGDMGNPEFRSWWIADAVNTASRGYIGIWIDDVNLSWRVSNGQGEIVIPRDARTGQMMTLDNYQRYFAEFMEEIRLALPEFTIAHNALWFTESPDFDNPYVARQIDAANFFNLERGATDRGLTGGKGQYGFETFLAFIDYIHDRGRNVILMDEAKTLIEREFALASWFLISNGGDIVSTENLSWSTPDSWWQAYDLELGNSAGPRYSWNRLLRRDFECGLVLVNPPDAATVTVTFSEPYFYLNGSLARSISLPAFNAAILHKPCVADSSPRTD